MQGLRRRTAASKTTRKGQLTQQLLHRRDHPLGWQPGKAVARAFDVSLAAFQSTRNARTAALHEAHVTRCLAADACPRVFIRRLATRPWAPLHRIRRAV